MIWCDGGEIGSNCHLINPLNMDLENTDGKLATFFKN